MDNNIPQQAPVQTTTTPMYKKGEFFERFAAYIIDFTIVTILLQIISAVLHFLFGDTQFWLYFLIPVLYASLFIWQKGATPGKMAVKLKVVTASYTRVGFGSALLRESIGKWISGLLFYLGYLWILIDKKSQTWHDKIANTLVVKLDSTGNLIPITGEEEVTKERKILFGILYCLCCLPIMLATLFLISYIFLFRPFQVTGDAMYPNYPNKAYYLTSLKYTNPTRGDVIVFKSPIDPEKDFIKRVIGLPGDTVMVLNGNIYVNNTLLDERKYLKSDVKTYGGSFLHDGEPTTVPPDHYFVVGDNRPYSSDSREWGFVSKNNTISKVAFCYWQCTGSLNK